jgi:hypothetical protein
MEAPAGQPTARKRRGDPHPAGFWAAAAVVPAALLWTGFGIRMAGMAGVCGDDEFLCLDEVFWFLAGLAWSAALLHLLLLPWLHRLRPTALVLSIVLASLFAAGTAANGFVPSTRESWFFTAASLLQLAASAAAWPHRVPRARAPGADAEWR